MSQERLAKGVITTASPRTRTTRLLAFALALPNWANGWTKSYPSLPAGFVVGPPRPQAGGTRVAPRRKAGGELEAGRSRGDSGGGKLSGAWWGQTRFRRRQRPWRRGRERGSPVVVDGGSGETEYYSWTETDADMEVRVSLPPGTPSKAVQLSVTRSSLTLGLRGRESPILKGTLLGEVQADMSHWTMEEMDDTGAKVLYLCLEKVVGDEDSEDWEGVLEGEEALNVWYANKDKAFDVNEYVKKMGYDRERDLDKVDKTMFSDLTSEMRQNLETNLPKTSFTEKDDMIPVVAEPKVSPIIDAGVLGVRPPNPSTAPPPSTTTTPRPEPVVGMAGAAAEAEVVSEDDVSTRWAAEGATDGTAGDSYSPAFEASSDALDGVGGLSAAAVSSTGELTARQREVSAGLRATYDDLVKSGMLQEELGPDGTPGSPPDMDELARTYDTEGGFMFKDGDFSEEELSKYAAATVASGAGGMPDIDIDDPAVRAAFGLD